MVCPAISYQYSPTRKRHLNSVEKIYILKHVSDMFGSISPASLEKFTTFGDLLRFLRRRLGMTQMELANAVGYSDAQISRLEQNLRPPDLSAIESRFVPALGLEEEPKTVARLL